MLDLDPRDYDSRDEERHAKTPSRQGRGSSGDHDRDHDWRHPDTRPRDRDDGDERSLGRGPGNDRQASDGNGPDRDRDPRWTDRDRDTRKRDPEVRDAFTRHVHLPRGRERERCTIEILKRRSRLGPNAFVFGTENGEFISNFKTAWESLLPVASGHDTKRAKPGARVDREKLREIDLHWHDIRHEGACRLLAGGVDLRIIQLMLGHASAADAALSERDRRGAAQKA
jgi:integrase-like protein